MNMPVKSYTSNTSYCTVDERHRHCRSTTKMSPTEDSMSHNKQRN